MAGVLSGGGDGGGGDGDGGGDGEGCSAFLSSVMGLVVAANIIVSKITKN